MRGLFKPFRKDKDKCYYESYGLGILLDVLDIDCTLSCDHYLLLKLSGQHSVLVCNFETGCVLEKFLKKPLSMHHFTNLKYV